MKGGKRMFPFSGRISRAGGFHVDGIVVWGTSSARKTNHDVTQVSYYWRIEQPLRVRKAQGLSSNEFHFLRHLNINTHAGGTTKKGIDKIY